MAMLLNSIIKGIEIQTVSGNLACEIEEITFDSRKCRPGSLFIAVSGTEADGHAYIGKALAAGARAVIYQNDTPGLEPGTASPSSRLRTAAGRSPWLPTTGTDILRGNSTWSA